MTKKEKAVFVSDSDGFTRVQVNGKPNASVPAYRAPTFAEFLRGKGLTEKAVKGDGNCFYRSVAELVYGDEGQYSRVRKEVMDHMQKNEDKYRPVVGDVKEFITKNRQDRVWADAEMMPGVRTRQHMYRNVAGIICPSCFFRDYLTIP